MNKQPASVACALAALVAGPASAQVYFDDDCGLLFEEVRELSASLLRGSLGGLAPDYDVPDSGGVAAHICDDAALATTSGFTAAAAQTGLPVRWSFNAANPYCDSTSLSNCFPYPDPASAPPSLEQQLLVASSWREVRARVMRSMPWGAGTNLAYYSAGSLRKLAGGRVDR